MLSPERATGGQLRKFRQFAKTSEIGHKTTSGIGHKGLMPYFTNLDSCAPPHDRKRYIHSTTGMRSRILRKLAPDSTAPRELSGKARCHAHTNSRKSPLLIQSVLTSTVKPIVSEAKLGLLKLLL